MLASFGARPALFHCEHDLMTNPRCPICHGLGWVCENHPHRARVPSLIPGTTKEERADAHSASGFWFGNCGVEYFGYITAVIRTLQWRMHSKVPKRSIAWRLYDHGCLRKSLVETQWADRERMREAGRTVAVMW